MLVIQTVDINLYIAVYFYLVIGKIVLQILIVSRTLHAWNIASNVRQLFWAYRKCSNTVQTKCQQATTQFWVQNTCFETAISSSERSNTPAKLGTICFDYFRFETFYVPLILPIYSYQLNSILFFKKKRLLIFEVFLDIVPWPKKLCSSFPFDRHIMTLEI